MNLINLPEEVFIIIVKQLDTKSLYNLYNTCHYTRNIVRMQGVIKECHFSLCTMATAQSLKTIFFKDIAGHLKELNLCGVYNLYKSGLLPAVKRLRRLETLNVAYTNITITDLIEIDKVCNTIKNITINFKFHKPIKYSSVEMIQCQNMFEHYKNVHFVGSCLNLLQNGLPLFLLKLAKLNKLTYTISRFKNSVENTPPAPRLITNDLNSFKELNIYLWEGLKQITFPRKLINFLFKSGSHDFIIINIVDLARYSVYCSEVFVQFFNENFAMKAVTDLNQLRFDGNIVIMFWNNMMIEYNDSFYSNLLKQIDQYFPCNFKSSNILPSREIDSNLFIIFPKQRDDESYKRIENYEMNSAKRRRIALPNIVLNYDELFRDKHKAQLKFCIWNSIITIAINSNFNYLTKLTYLSLSGLIRYSSDFFKTVFGSCDNLVTLNVEAEPLTPQISYISQSIHLCQKLKHLRLIDRSINFSTLFSSLSQCKTLEIINLCDQSREYCDLADPSSIFENCNNLYYFCIFASMSNTVKSKKRAMLRKARSNYRRPVYVNLFTNYNDSDLIYNYDPYLEVFLLNKQR